jgi:hypothetical protein
MSVIVTGVAAWRPQGLPKVVKMVMRIIESLAQQ